MNRMSNIELPVSIGEALDKLTILDIKVEKITNEQKKADCKKERDVLYAKLKFYVEKYSFWYKALKEVNDEIWCKQDILRATNNTEDLAKRVLDLNDLRFRIKNKLNIYSSSFLKEQKGYQAKNIILQHPMNIKEAFEHRDILYYLSIEYDAVYLSISDGTLKELFLENIYLYNSRQPLPSSIQGTLYEKPLSRESIHDLHLSNQVLKSLIPKSSLFIGHLGLGDMIGLNGAVNYLSEECDEIFVVTYTKNYSSLKTMYQENYKVKLFTIDEESIIWVQDKLTQSFESLFQYFHKIYRSGIYLPNHEICVDVPNSFYRDLQIPLKVKMTHFSLPNLQESKDLINILGDREFIFVQQKASDILCKLIHWDKSKILTIDPNINVYEPFDEFYPIAEKCRNLPFFHYIDLLKGAKEIHVVNSSFCCLLLLLPSIKAKVKKIYDRYTGKISEVTTLLEDYELDKKRKEIQCILEKYEIQPVENNSLRGKAMGLGDLMLNVRCLKLGFLRPPITINVSLFEVCYDNPANALEFRIQFIRDLLQYNGLSPQSVQYIRSTNLDVDQNYRWREITFNPLDFSITTLPTFLKDKKYIVIHTKCRHTNKLNYNLLKQVIQEFSTNVLFPVPVVLMGERTFPNNFEHKIHGITTVYNELVPLKEKNTVYDLTKEEIYDSLDYEIFKHDLSIMRGASLNIHFGLGGSVSACMNFCRNMITFIDDTDEVHFNRELLLKDKIYIYNNLMDFFNGMNDLLMNL